MNDSGLNMPTKKQLRALAAIHELAGQGGAGPVLRELAARLELSAVSSAQHRVIELEREGLVTFERTARQLRVASRTLRLTDKGRRVLTRYARLQTTQILRGDRELVLDAQALLVAKKIKLPLMGYRVRGEKGKSVVVFEERKERDFWAGLLLQALEEDNES
jgi:DNA-binding MarR family transcriptional regulator